MASSSDPTGSTTNWKENMTVVVKENLYEHILGIFKDQVPPFACNPEVHARLLRNIRSWAEKFLNETIDQEEYVEKISRQICLLFAKVEVNLVPKALAEAAKAKEQQAQTTSRAPTVDSLERMMHQLQVKCEAETLEQQAGTSNAPYMCSTSQQPLVTQRTGDFCTSEDVNLPPKKLVQEILEDDARRSLANEKWRLHYAKHEVQYLRYQLPSLIFAFVDITLKTLLLLQDLDQCRNDEDEYFTTRVRECIKRVVTPKLYLPEDFNENCFEYLKLEIHHLVEKHKRLSSNSFETHRRLSRQR